MVAKAAGLKERKRTMQKKTSQDELLRVVTSLFLGASATQLRLGSAKLIKMNTPRWKSKLQRSGNSTDVIRGATFKPRLQNKHQLTVWLPLFTLLSCLNGDSTSPKLKDWEALRNTSEIRNSTYAPEPRKKPSYFPLYWLVNRDPYIGLL